MDAIVVRNLNFSYGKNNIFKNLNFVLSPQNVSGLLGDNGTGKTTLLKILTGEIHGDFDISIFDEHTDIRNNRQRKIIQFLPDDINIPDYLTVSEFFDFVIDIYDLDKKATNENIKRYIDLFSMTEYFENKLIKRFSHGMKKKTQIVASLLVKPEKYLMDEPTNGLDFKTVNLLEKIIVEEKNRGAAFVVSSHDLQFVKSVCDKVYTITNNQLSESLL